MGGCLLLGRGQYEQYETSTKPVRKSSEGRAKKQIVPYGTYSYEDLFLNVHVLSPRDDGVLGVMVVVAGKSFPITRCKRLLHVTLHVHTMEPQLLAVCPIRRLDLHG